MSRQTRNRFRLPYVCFTEKPPEGILPPLNVRGQGPFEAKRREGGRCRFMPIDIPWVKMGAENRIAAIPMPRQERICLPAIGGIVVNPPNIMVAKIQRDSEP